MTSDTAAPTSAPAGDAAPGDDASLAARNKLVIGLLLVSAFVVILNETIMGVALPEPHARPRHHRRPPASG